jgi:hypothetical protein
MAFAKRVPEGPLAPPRVTMAMALPPSPSPGPFWARLVYLLLSALSTTLRTVIADQCWARRGLRPSASNRVAISR